MSVTFKPVIEREDIVTLSKIASEIWNEYWPEHIGQDQTDYMVGSYQSLEALLRDIERNAYEYWFVVDGDQIVGYTGGYVEDATNRFFISKIYLYADQRGKGYASRVVKFYDDLGQERNLDALYLTVNKYNELGTRAYLAKGFDVIDSVETDIGSGFIMDDYIMERTVGKPF